MSALDLLFMGDVIWQTHRIAGSLADLRRDQAYQHIDNQASLRRLEALESQSAQLAQQRLSLLERSQSEETKRRQVTAALVLHENELDRLLAAGNDLLMPDDKNSQSVRMLAVRHTLDNAIAFKARTITLGVALSGFTISDIPTINEQRQFLAIVQKAEWQWQHFCHNHPQAVADEIELAVVSLLCEKTMKHILFDTVAYATVANDVDLLPHFDGTHAAVVDDAPTDAPRENSGLAALFALLGICAGGGAGFYLGLSVMHEGGFWNIIAGAFWMIVLTPTGAAFGCLFGKAIGQTTSSDMTSSRRMEILKSRNAILDRAADAASANLLALNNGRLDFDPSGAWFKSYIKTFPPNVAQQLWQRISTFWSSLTNASPAIAAFNVYNFDTDTIDNPNAMEAYVAVVLARIAQAPSN